MELTLTGRNMLFSLTIYRSILKDNSQVLMWEFPSAIIWVCKPPIQMQQFVDYYFHRCTKLI